MQIIRTEERVWLTDEELHNVQRTLCILREVMQTAETEKLSESACEAYDQLNIFYQNLLRDE